MRQGRSVCHTEIVVGVSGGLERVALCDTCYAPGYMWTENLQGEVLNPLQVLEALRKYFAKPIPQDGHLLWMHGTTWQEDIPATLAAAAAIEATSYEWVGGSDPWRFCPERWYLSTPDGWTEKEAYQELVRLERDISREVSEAYQELVRLERDISRESL